MLMMVFVSNDLNNQVASIAATLIVAIIDNRLLVDHAFLDGQDILCLSLCLG